MHSLTSGWMSGKDKARSAKRQTREALFLPLGFVLA